MNRNLRLTASLFILGATLVPCCADDRAAQDYNWQDDFRCFLRPEIRVVREEDSFSPKEWKDALAAPNPGDGNFICRKVEFRQFLRDYDLIGMSRKRVIELLGPEDFSGHYMIIAGGCGRGNESVCLRYGNDDIVTGWRLESARMTKPADGWISKNVTFTPW